MVRLIAFILCASVLAGCDDSQRETAEQGNPHISKGQELAKQKNWDDAIRELETALEDHPQYASPDLELALIYHEQKRNYARAIYHYERYLEKRPDTEKAQLITGWILQAKTLIAAEVGRTGDGIPEEIIRLKRENNLLRSQLIAVARPAPPRQPPPVAVPEPMPIPKPEEIRPEPTPVSQTPIPRIQTPAPMPETYKVLPGDTLSKIARTMYGDSSKWEKIYGANLDKMESPNDLKAGQTITIPKIKSKEELKREANAPPLG